MANFNQAPALQAIGEKDRNFHNYKGFASRTQTLEYGMMNFLGDRDFAMFKVMMFLTGNKANAEFKVSTDTICSWCKISETGYKNVRKKLMDMGWIQHKEKEYIRVMYDKIYQDIELMWSTESTPLVEQGSTGNTPKKLGSTELTSTGNTPKKLGSTELTSTGNTPKKLGVTENTSILKGVTGNTPSTSTGNTPLGVTGNTHNNISNNINQQDKLPQPQYVDASGKEYIF